MNFESISLWLAQHPDWILGCIFGIALLESLAMVGLLSPGIALLFAAGTAAGTANISYWVVLLAAYVGAVIGDVLSYGLGARFHSRVVQMPPFKQHPEWIDKAEAFFHRYGLYGLFVGRFIGPLRPVLPMIAGALEMPFLKFLLLDLCSGPLWAVVYLTPGYLVGNAAGAPVGDAQKFLMVAAALVALAFVIAELLWRFSHRERTPRQHVVTAQTVLLLSGLLLVTLFYTVVSHVADPINRWLAVEAAHLRRGDADLFFVALTSLGDMKPMVVWGIAVAIALALQGAWWPLAIWMLGTLAGNALMHTMKNSLGIERPHLSERVPEGFSFPSGHASMGMIFTGLITTVLWPSLSPKARRVMLHGVALYVVLMTTSRLYLGAHWTSDLLAGWALASGLLALCWLLLRSAPPSLAVTLARPRPALLLAASVIAWAVMAFTYIHPQFEQAMWRYAPLLQTGTLP